MVCDFRVTLLGAASGRLARMKDARRAVRSTFLTHTAWILGVCVTAFAVFYIAIASLNGSERLLPQENLRWGVLALILGGSLLLGLGLLVALHLKVVAPSQERLDEVDQLVARTRLMQTAMTPALSLIQEGISHHETIIDALTQSLQANVPPPTGIAAKEYMMQRIMIANTLAELRGDMASRRQIVETLQAANDTIGKRLSELNVMVEKTRASLNSSEQPSGEGDGSVRNKAPLQSRGPDEQAPGAAADTDAGNDFSAKPWIMGLPPELKWNDGTDKALMPKFKFTDEQTKRRFELN